MKKKFKRDIFANKKILLMGPAQTAKSDEDDINLDDFDYVVRCNLILNCFANNEIPRTDVIFVNQRATRVLISDYSETYENKIILTKASSRKLGSRYPKSIVSITRVRIKEFKKIHKMKNLYMGTHTLAWLLQSGANVTYGGTDFYWTGFSDATNYPDKYDFVPTKSGNESGKHKMSGDLRFIKNYLMTEYQGKLHLLPKTQYYFEKSLEKYGIV